jgi:predicted  nucleic acid-binding Zn-ribbon protein
MGTEPNAMVCTSCGRRFADEEVLQSGLCPACGGDLKPLEEADDPDQPWGDDEGG